MRLCGLTLAAFLFVGCTITVKPLPVSNHRKYHPAAVHHRHKVSHPPEPKEETHNVSSEWMTNYKQLEAQFDHSIAADADITPRGGGFSVPQAVIDHFGDMVRAHPAQPEPH